MATLEKIPNYVAGQWRQISATESQQVLNPANQEILAESPLSSAADVDAAVEAAASAFPEWRRTPREDRIQPLFKLKHLLELHLDSWPASSRENGKTLAEAKGAISGLPHPWRISPSAAGRTASPGTSMGRGATEWSSTPTKKSSRNVGQRPLAQVLITQTGE